MTPETSAPSSPPTPGEVDCLVVGAGPVGLYQVFQLGLQELSCAVVDALPFLGGQCAELYPDKPIHDLPGLLACSGAELVGRLVRQLEPFKPRCVLGQEIVALAAEPDGRWRLGDAAGRVWLARSVVLAAGVGAFAPRRLKLAGIEALEGRQVWHREPRAGDSIGAVPWVHGGDDRALDAVTALVDLGAPVVHLLYRREVYPASAARVARLEGLIAEGRVVRHVGQPESLLLDDAGRLVGIAWMAADGSAPAAPASSLHVSLGLNPRLGPLADWDLGLARKQVPVDPATFETRLPGIHAVGDVCSYPGKLKLIVSGFHEATLAAHAIAHRLRPDAPRILEYTTSSARLQRILGVDATHAARDTP
ncbi:NAD(P)/FAD-dependent oxidoreductase [Leptothrix discophora]|uniref:Ferredoxin--NADP reductase n=1 Tax=Leptothrix discophora TaxID=89 RepID=A0ABT9FXP8_LEPDI|nr:NAD(P)/FAD-dependent oxidoreductase [Leptothrix discophora]MDP4299014.1 NAD(P)/FAD-dependent oxidoreductase [Leptothrix discophora]